MSAILAQPLGGELFVCALSLETNSTEMKQRG